MLISHFTPNSVSRVFLQVNITKMVFLTAPQWFAESTTKDGGWRDSVVLYMLIRLPFMVRQKPFFLRKGNHLWPHTKSDQLFSICVLTVWLYTRRKTGKLLSSFWWKVILKDPRFVQISKKWQIWSIIAIFGKWIFGQVSNFNKASVLWCSPTDSACSFLLSCQLPALQHSSM